MRRIFQKRLGITPKVYRERFATTGVHEEFVVATKSLFR
jgi:hypothetical protein